MSMPSGPSTAAVVIALAAGCSLLAYGASRLTSSKSSPNRDLAEIDDEIDDDDYITPDDVVAVFDKLFMQMQQVVIQLSQQVQQIQMAGQQIPEAQLRQLLRGEFERALMSLQAQVFEDNDIDADCLEEATWEFMESPEEYPKVKRAVERFQKLYDSISGRDTAGWTPNKAEKGEGDKTAVANRDLSPDEILIAAKLYFDAITESMIRLARSWRESGKDLNSKQFQMEASTEGNEAGEEKLKSELGITMSDFRKALDKHSGNPSVGQTLGMLQIKQQQELMAAGIPMM